MIIPQGLKSFGLVGKPLRLTRNIKRTQHSIEDHYGAQVSEREVEVKEKEVPQDLVLKPRD